MRNQVSSRLFSPSPQRLGMLFLGFVWYLYYQYVLSRFQLGVFAHRSTQQQHKIRCHSVDLWIINYFLRILSHNFVDVNTFSSFAVSFASMKFLLHPLSCSYICFVWIPFPSTKTTAENINISKTFFLRNLKIKKYTELNFVTGKKFCVCFHPLVYWNINPTKISLRLGWRHVSKSQRSTQAKELRVKRRKKKVSAATTKTKATSSSWDPLSMVERKS